MEQQRLTHLEFQYASPAMRDEKNITQRHHLEIVKAERIMGNFSSLPLIFTVFIVNLDEQPWLLPVFLEGGRVRFHQ